ncbi:MAG: 50S ribosomal protein L23 [Patescibacteria group bacterium]|nr:50S ribosomal protein L23 [Patescibacteria group bacterium]
MDLQNILIRPIVTEKSMADAGTGKFTFEVAKEADKGMIKKAVENKFKVNVVSVSTSIVKGKKKRQGNRRKEVLGSSWKKAIVRLKTGEKIGLFETVK